jgi:nucleoid-associated protein YgaU
VVSCDAAKNSLMQVKNTGGKADKTGVEIMNQYKALMAGFATVVGLGGVASYNGYFSTPSAPIQEPAAVVAAVDPVKVEPAKVEPAPVEVAKVTPEATAPAKTETPVVTTETAAPAPEKPNLAPTFDVLRVESNGSVLIAGKAEKDAQVEVLSGANVLGTIKAQANGDFAIVIENPLKPGDYQLVLRQTLVDGTSATSVETATVSVPEKLNGPVLALVEEPGKPSRIITAPAAAEVVVQAEVKTPTATSEVTDPAKPAEEQVVVPTDQIAAPAVEPAPAIASGSVTIEAVETENGNIFVAGAAKGVGTVRIYANDVILGEIKPLAGDRYLLEVKKDLAAGDYIIKAEGLAADGVTVLGRSTVPFNSANQALAAATPSQDTASGTQSSDATPDKKLAVIIRRGDTLWQISRRIYGRGVRYSTIYLANKDAIPNPNKIFPGQVVAIPDSTPEGDAASAEEIKKRDTSQ